MKARRLVAGLGTAVLALAVCAAPAGADLYTPWSSMLPGWNDQFVPSSDNDCAAGRPACLTATLKEESRILSQVGSSCSHNAIFPMAYLRMTQTYGWTR